MANKDDEFYDSVYSKYHTPAPDWSSHPKRNYRAKKTQEELLVILREIANKTGFNINAPAAYFDKAKELMEELKKRLQHEENYAKLEYIINKAEWALINKLDHMEAIEFIKKIELG